MKIYVGFYTYPYEGCSIPEIAFEKKSDIEEWLDKNDSNYREADYTILEV